LLMKPLLARKSSRRRGGGKTHNDREEKRQRNRCGLLCYLAKDRKWSDKHIRRNSQSLIGIGFASLHSCARSLRLPGAIPHVLHIATLMTVQGAHCRIATSGNVRTGKGLCERGSACRHQGKHHCDPQNLFRNVGQSHNIYTILRRNRPINRSESIVHCPA
jgi:hypothetical protein